MTLGKPVKIILSVKKRKYVETDKRRWLGNAFIV